MRPHNIYLIFATSVLAVSLSVCHDQKEPDIGEQVAELEARIGFSLPEGIEVKGIRINPGRASLAQAKLRMNRSAYDVFRQRCPIKDEAFRPGPRGLITQDRGFWDPRKAKNLRTGQAHLPGATALNVGLDESNPDAVVVYIQYHGT